MLHIPAHKAAGSDHDGPPASAKPAPPISVLRDEFEWPDTDWSDDEPTERPESVQ